MKRKKLIRAVSLVLCMAMFSACGTDKASQVIKDVAEPEQTAVEMETAGESETVSTQDVKEEKTVTLSVQAVSLPDAAWQKDVTFPDWKGYVDDTLAMNGMVSFRGYEGQGKIYVTPDKNVTGFRMYVNNCEVDTSLINAGESYVIDTSEAAVNGINTLQISEISPYDPKACVRVSIPYPEIFAGTPVEEGISEEALQFISDIIDADVEQGFPGAQLAVVRNGKLVYENAWGKTRADSEGTPVTIDTLFDLASVTKMFAVNYAIQKLLTDGRIRLDDKAADYIGERFSSLELEGQYAGGIDPERDRKLRQAITIRDLLRHQSGFSGDPRYYNPYMDVNKPHDDQGNTNRLYAGNDGSAETKENTVNAICRTPLRYEPGTSTVYSDINYMLLGVIIEEITGSDLNTWLRHEFWEPMGLKNITYEPMENGFTAADCAATEPNGNTRDGNVIFPGVRTETVQGEVHDELAYYNMGGVSGHAGLFANASDLAKLASVMLTGGYGENRFFSRNVMDTFASPGKEDAANWGLGWYREGDDQRVWYFGTQAAPDTIGHQGWTGTMVMIDPSRELVVVYLTNKVNSPVTEPEENLNKFEGGCYTASTLGFVPQILSVGIDHADEIEPLAALAADMATEASRLIADDAWVEHPLVRNLRARISVLKKWAERTDTGKEDRLMLADELTQDYFYLAEPDVAFVAKTLAGMDTRQKISQMLMPHIRTWGEGDGAKDVTVLNDELAEALKKYAFGGVILFAQNYENAEQMAELTASIRKTAEESGAPGMLISIDQEGGSVTRLGTGTQMPGNMALGATGDPADTKKAAQVIGEELTALGINVDFAPVLDVNSNPANPIIGVRSFSDDALTVRKFGKAYQAGLHSMGVMTALKHFPGHGDTDTDSHTGLPVIDKSLDELKDEELQAYMGNLKRADMVMTAHIRYPQIEKSVYVSRKTGKEITLPATLSSEIITGVLREELGFEGVVVTDAMDMDAISVHFDPMDAAKLAINAGVDIILMPVEMRDKKDIEEMGDYIDSIAELAEAGEIEMEKIDAAVTRILNMKYRYGLLPGQDYPVVRETPAASTVGSAEHHDKEWEIAKRAVTLLKNDDNTLPVTDAKRVLIACPYESEINSCEYAADRLREEGKLPDDTDVNVVCYSGLTGSDAESLAKDADAVIAVSVIYSRNSMDPNSEKGAGSVFLDKLLATSHENGRRFVLLSAELPYDTARYPQADAILACYNAKGMSEKPAQGKKDLPQYGPNVPAAIYTILGGNSPTGKLPVNIPGFDTGSGNYTGEIIFARGSGMQYQ